MEPSGHQYLTDEAINAALVKLPQNLRWVRHFVRGSTDGSVYRNMEDVFTFGHWTEEGQRHHFMRSGAEGELHAYMVGCEWIYKMPIRRPRTSVGSGRSNWATTIRCSSLSLWAMPCTRCKIRMPWRIASARRAVTPS